jgi:hypothetical protein
MPKYQAFHGTPNLKSACKREMSWLVWVSLGQSGSVRVSLGQTDLV